MGHIRFVRRIAGQTTVLGGQTVFQILNELHGDPPHLQALPWQGSYDRPNLPAISEMLLPVFVDYFCLYGLKTRDLNAHSSIESFFKHFLHFRCSFFSFSAKRNANAKALHTHNN